MCLECGDDGVFQCDPLCRPLWYAICDCEQGEAFTLRFSNIRSKQRHGTQRPRNYRRGNYNKRNVSDDKDRRTEMEGLNMDTWDILIEEIKASDLTDDMKRACLAQAILESGRGKSRVATLCKNFWGMKFRPELSKIATPMTVEVTSEDSGSDVFAAFVSEADALRGWRLFLTRTPYKGWEQYANDSVAFINHIAKAWCPRRDYAQKVIALLREARHLLEGQRVKVERWLLDPGHSNAEPGARSNDRTAREEVLNLLQAETIAKALLGKVHCEIYNPSVDNLIEIGQRAADYDGFVSLHHNSYSGDGDPGTEVFVSRGAKKQSHVFAELVCDNVCDALGSVNRGVKEAGYTVIRNAEKVCAGPVVLIESYFLNPYSETGAKKRSIAAAEAIAKSIADLIGLK